MPAAAALAALAEEIAIIRMLFRADLEDLADGALERAEEAAEELLRDLERQTDGA